jgi:hypothetical protein
MGPCRRSVRGHTRRCVRSGGSRQLQCAAPPARSGIDQGSFPQRARTGEPSVLDWQRGYTTRATISSVPSHRVTSHGRLALPVPRSVADRATEVSSREERCLFCNAELLDPINTAHLQVANLSATVDTHDSGQSRLIFVHAYARYYGYTAKTRAWLPRGRGRSGTWPDPEGLQDVKRRRRKSLARSIPALRPK